MNRFLLFTGSYYYPRGGWKDFKASFDLLEEAAQAGRNSNREWWHIVDTETGEIVSESD
jgi:hypothetical protein